MTYPLGALVPFTWTGASTAATLTVTLPDGTTTAPTVTGSAGAWAASYTPVQVGRHLVRWTGSSPAAASAPDMFEVLPATLGPLISLADARAHLNWTSSTGTSNDAELMDVVLSASDTIEGYLGRPVRRQTFAEQYNAPPGGIALRQTPCACSACEPYRVLTVASIVIGTVTLTSGTDYALDPATGIIWPGPYPIPGGSFAVSGAVTVTYTAGYTATPGWAQMATKRLVEHLWTRSQAPRHSRSAQPEPTEVQPSPTYLLPYMVQSLLEPHRAEGF